MGGENEGKEKKEEREEDGVQPSHGETEMKRATDLCGLSRAGVRDERGMCEDLCGCC